MIEKCDQRVSRKIFCTTTAIEFADCSQRESFYSLRARPASGAKDESEKTSNLPVAHLSVGTAQLAKKTLRLPKRRRNHMP